MLIEYIGNQGTASWSTTENGNVRLRMEMYEKIYHNFLCLGIFFKSFLIGHFPKALVLCPMSTKCSRTVYGQKTLALG